MLTCVIANGERGIASLEHVLNHHVFGTELQPAITFDIGSTYQHCKMSCKRAWPVVALFAASRGLHMVVYSRGHRKSIVRAWCMPVALNQLLFSHQLRIWPLARQAVVCDAVPLCMWTVLSRAL